MSVVLTPLVGLGLSLLATAAPTDQNPLAAGQAALERGDTAAALAHFRQAVEQEPEQSEPHRWLAWLLVGQREYEEAARHFEAFLALTTPPGKDAVEELREAGAWLCEYYEGQANWVALEQAAQRLRTLDPDWPEHALALAAARLGQGDHDGAWEAFPPLTAFRREREPSGRDEAADDPGLRRAWAAIQQLARWGLTEQALNRSAALLKEQPNDGFLLSIVGLLHGVSNTLEKAVAPLLQALRQRGRVSVWWELNWIRPHLEVIRREDVLVALLEGAFFQAEEPVLPRANLVPWLVQAYRRTEQLDAAAAKVRAASEKAPQDGPLLRLLAEVEAARGDLEAALAAWRTLTERHPDDARAWWDLGAGLRAVRPPGGSPGRLRAGPGPDGHARGAAAAAGGNRAGEGDHRDGGATAGRAARGDRRGPAPTAWSPCRRRTAACRATLPWSAGSNPWAADRAGSRCA